MVRSPQRQFWFFVISVRASVDAFVPNSLWRRTPQHDTTAVCRYLTIHDGNDLVAASQQVYRPLVSDDGDEEAEDDAIPLEAATSTTTTNLPPSMITSPRRAALSIVTRLFATPTAAFHPHEGESLDEYDVNADIDYFPVRLHHASYA